MPGRASSRRRPGRGRDAGVIGRGSDATRGRGRRGRVPARTALARRRRRRLSGFSPAHRCGGEVCIAFVIYTSPDLAERANMPVPETFSNSNLVSSRLHPVNPDNEDCAPSPTM
ncbi:hypothetical protein RHCRD62_10749 [Rhodococcus sp. RD6.2]|nr:hypothetical protein RHCRD62_10749 [Rhodococcus sp. RD6.2]